MDMDHKWFCMAVVVLMLQDGIAMGHPNVTTIAYTGETTLIDCPIQGVLWKGPPGDIIYFMPGSSNFNPALGEKINRLSIVRFNKGLQLLNTRLSDAGTYSCCTCVQDGTTVYNTVYVRRRTAVPEITSSVQVDSRGIMVTEGHVLTITCTSRGGYPAPTVAWYRGNITGQELARTSTGTRVGDTYTVTLNYTFTPTRLDDGKKLVCRSYWPSPHESHSTGSLNSNVTIFVNYLSPPYKIEGQAADHQSLIVSWSSTGLPKEFVIQYSTDSTDWRNMSVQAVAATSRSHSMVIDGLAGGRMFYIRMLSKTGQDESAWSSVVHAKTATFPCAGPLG